MICAYQDDNEKKEISKQIQDDVNYIGKQIHKHRSPKVLSTLFGEMQTLEEYVSYVDLDVNFPEFFFVDNSKFEKMYNDYYERLFKHFERMYRINKDFAYKINSMFEENGINQYSNKYRVRVNPYQLATEFLRSFDKDIYDYFLINSKKGNYFDWLIEPSTYGVTLDLKTCDKRYVMINNMLDNNILKASVISHETVHAYLMYHSKNKSYEQEGQEQLNYLHEVYPILVQLVFAEWLKKIGFKERDIRVLEGSYKTNFMDFADAFGSDLYSIEQFIDPAIVKEYYENEGELENLENAIIMLDFLRELKINKTPEEIMEHQESIQIQLEDESGNKLDKTSVLSSLVDSDAYFYGYFLAYHYLYLYHQNPKKTKDLVTRMSLESCNHDKPYMLENYGLGMNRLKDTKPIKKLIYKKGYY